MGCVVSFFQYGSYDVKEASEQPAEDEGIRRDIPEPEYGKSSESTINSNVIQETKPDESEVTKSSLPEEKKEISEPPLSSTLVQESHPSQTEVTKSNLSDEPKEISISKIENIQVNVDEEPKISITKEKETENDGDNLEEAVVKIQAGIRGYLTRKTLKEQRESVSPSKSPNPEESNRDVLNKFEGDAEKQIDDEKVTAESNTLQEVPVDSNEDDVKKAAVKIQSLYRGYRTRKNLSNIGDELIEESDDFIDETKDKTEEDITSSQKETLSTCIKENEEAEEESEEGALEQAAVKIQSTFRGYQVRKQRKNGPKKEDTKEQLLADINQDENENEKFETDDSEAEGKAAVKIQAMYRGYKVRKEIKMIGEDGDEIEESVEEEDSKHEETTDFDKSNTNINLDENSDKADDDGILKSKTTIVLSTTNKENEENVLLKNFNTDLVQPTAESTSLLDKNNEEQCFQKPMVPITNEATIPKSISEPTVDLNSISKSNENHSLSPSSD